MARISNTSSSGAGLSSVFKILAGGAVFAAAAGLLGTKVPAAIADVKNHQTAAILKTCKEQYKNAAARDGNDMTDADLPTITLQGGNCTTDGQVWNPQISGDGSNGLAASI